MTKNSHHVYKTFNLNKAKAIRSSHGRIHNEQLRLRQNLDVKVPNTIVSTCPGWSERLAASRRLFPCT